MASGRFDGVLRWYLLGARARVASGGRSLTDHLFDRWPVAARGRKNLEYWLTCEPYASSRRVIGRVDHILQFQVRGESRIVIRGWMFDLIAPVMRLSVSVDQGLTGTTVCSINRPDVAAAFPGEPNALPSGFMSTLVCDNSRVRDEIMLKYSTRGGFSSCLNLAVSAEAKVQIFSPLTARQLPEQRNGQRNVQRDEQRDEQGEAQGWGALILLDHDLAGEVVDRIMNAMKACGIAPILLPGVDNDISDGERSPKCSSERCAGSLPQLDCGLGQPRCIVLLGEVTSSSLADNLIPLAMFPDYPPISWITHGIPRELSLPLRGDFVRFLDRSRVRFPDEFRTFLTSLP